MNWKIFTTACISSVLISFPYNIIGCGPGIDAYDYYTSFFNADIATNTSFRPFYYTAYADLYSNEEPVSTADILAEEWKNYAGAGVNNSDAKVFVMEYDVKDITTLYNNIEKNKQAKLPTALMQNSMTKYFLQQKDVEALGYIIYAKKVEPLVNNTDTWDTKVKDIATMEKLIKNGLQLYAAAKKDIFKLKYGYQITKLAMYSGSNNDAIRYYDELVAPTKTESVLQPLALSLKAGALFRTGNAKQAAYLYSKAFAATDAKKISNYISFKWAAKAGTSKQEYIQLCSNNAEKANMLALFALNSTANESSTIEKIYALNPQNKAIETLIAREINKTEDNYLAPLLNKQAGGKQFFYTWDDADDDKNKTRKQEVQSLKETLVNIAKSPKQNNALYYTSAAYCSFILQDYKKANEYLRAAKALNPAAKINDQWQLTNLLVAINEANKIGVIEENKLMPSIKWLQQKALGEKLQTGSYNDFSVWKTFYRNIMTVALAKKYHAQGDVFKEALCVGAAEKVFNNYDYNTLEFLRNNTDIKDVENLYSLMNAKNNTAFDAFLIKNNSLTVANVTDFAGTGYIRNYDYENAIKWLQKTGASKKDTIYKSAFIELINDVEERLPTEKKTTSKLLFAQEMLATQNLVKADPTNAAKHYYKMATGMYNITYYGHAWELVQYYRSGSDGYEIPTNATEFQKQYYGCYAAHDMYKKAMEKSNDKNLKAKCLFMMAKCSQKTAGKKYGYFEPNYTYEKKEAAEKEFMKNFKNNKYFPEFIKDYKGTPFYEEAYSRCSYLRDFVQKNNY